MAAPSPTGGLERDLEAEAGVRLRLLSVPGGVAGGVAAPRSERSDSDKDRGAGLALISASTRFRYSSTLGSFF